MTPAGPPHDIGPLVMAIVALCVLYWRIAIQFVAIAVIFVTIYGAVLFVEGLHH